MTKYIKVKRLILFVFICIPVLVFVATVQL